MRGKDFRPGSMNLPVFNALIMKHVIDYAFVYNGYTEKRVLSFELMKHL